MTTAQIPAEALERAGLSAAAVAEWAASAPGPGLSFRAAADAVGVFLTRGHELTLRLPGPAQGTADERAARAAIAETMNQARETFLRAHAEDLYDALTDRCIKPLRLAELLRDAAAAVPGLVPTSAQLDAERTRMLPEKEGIELAQGLLVGYVLAVPRTGRHLITAMLRPVPEAYERLGELRSRGTVDLGPVRVTRRGRAGLLELANPRHLNAEDDVTLAPTECAVDMILLDPDIEVGVIRGGPVDHPRYPGTRVFGSGLNLTRLYHGRIDFLFFLERDLGYVHKIYRGITGVAEGAGAWGGADAGGPGGWRAAGADSGGAGGPGGWRAGADPGGTGGSVLAERTTEKLWVAAVERLAVGGACQLLHVVDHVIATRGSRLFLPARKEGIIPGASNLRLPRFVGDRAARQAILSGREWVAGQPDAALLCDEVVEPGEMDRALEARIDTLTNSGLVNATANRAAFRAGQEPLDLFREYMAVFSVEQARCHLSPALVRNLEVHWNARGRRL